MSQKYDKLKTLLKELFQLDQPDLDFGLYRIMHAKSAEVTQFLDQDLLPQVKDAFALYKSADKSELEKDLAKAIEQANGLGVDPETTQKVKDLRARLATNSVDVGALESEVYDRLYGFFRRYYTEGDFLSKRVYKSGVYAIPYEGEEVKLHWANADQYYIKSSEYLHDYAFRLRPADEKAPMRVHLRLANVAEGEHGNAKAAEERGRVFVLAPGSENGHAFIAEEDGEQGEELVISFEYRPATLTDWPEEQRDGKKKAPAQKDLIRLASEQLLAVDDASLAPWIRELGKPHVLASGEQADYSRIEAHLRRYTARNTFDYFIHKDLGGFLRRELDFYIKNEVMHLDDIENETAPRVEQYLSKIKVIRSIAGKIIDFLAQLEEFQKKLWLKKKFVAETHYYITLDQVPEDMFSEIAENDLQRKEWVRLFAIDRIEGDLTSPGDSVPLTPEFLKGNLGLPISTRLFAQSLRNGVLAALDLHDRSLTGVLFSGDNSDACRLMSSTLSSQIDTVYMDPPYNTQKREFPYKDDYPHSSWLAFLDERASAAQKLLRREGVLMSSVDRNEFHRMLLLLDEIFGDGNRIAELVWERGRKNDAKHVSLSHEYFLLYAKDWEALRSKYPSWREPKPALEQAKRQFHRLRELHGDDFASIRRDFSLWAGTKLEPTEARSLLLYRKIDASGPYRDDTDLSWPGGGGPRYEVTNPATGDSAEIPTRGWGFVEETMKEKLARGEVEFDPANPRRLLMKRYYFNDDEQVKSSVLYKHSKAASRMIRKLFGSDVFSNPKDHELIAGLIDYVTPEGGIVLDHFAGSGTTAQAVFDLNRSRGRQLRFVLAELEHYFESILLPRVLKSAYSPQWTDGRPTTRTESSSCVLKCVRLETYEDALNNLQLVRSDAQRSFLEAPEALGADGPNEGYLLRYMLEVETRGSQSLLNVQEFADPTAYKLKVKRPGSDESREVNVDLLETFNWLIGLTAQQIAAPQSFSGAFERDSEKRLRLAGRLKPGPGGRWWFRAVSGTTPDGRRTLVIWRKLTGNPEEDNLVLDEWFTKQGYSSKDSEFDLIYVNGGNNLENLRARDDTWKVRLIEEDFHRLMFETESL